MYVYPEERGVGRVRTRTRHGKKKLQREELGASTGTAPGRDSQAVCVVSSVLELFRGVTERELRGVDPSLGGDDEVVQVSLLSASRVRKLLMLEGCPTKCTHRSS